MVGTYLAKIHRHPERSRVVMERPGSVGGHSIRIKKTIELAAGEPEPVGPLRARRPARRQSAFISPWKSTWPPWPATRQTAITSTPAGTRLGLLDARLDLPHTRGLTADRPMARPSVKPEPGRNPPGSGASRSRRSARAKAASKAFTNRRRSSPTGTSRPTPMAAGTCGFAGPATRPTTPGSANTRHAPGRRRFHRSSHA